MYISLGGHLVIDITRKVVEYVALGVVVAGCTYLVHDVITEDVPETPEVNPIN